MGLVRIPKKQDRTLRGYAKIFEGSEVFLHIYIYMLCTSCSQLEEYGKQPYFIDKTRKSEN